MILHKSISPKKNEVNEIDSQSLVSCQTNLELD